MFNISVHVMLNILYQFLTVTTKDCCISAMEYLKTCILLQY